VTTSEAAFNRDLFRSVFAQAGLAGTAPGAGSTVTPVPSPTATNQINLHQHFGDTKAAHPVAARGGRRFSLFHRRDKERSTIKSINLSDLAAFATAADPVTPAAPAATPASVAGAGSGTAQ
jgi:hypothetical protein